MKKVNFNLILGVFFAFALCFGACKKTDNPTPDNPTPDNPTPDNPNANDVVVTSGLFCYFDFDGDEIVDLGDNYTAVNNGAVASTDTPSGKGKSMQFSGESFIEVNDNIVPGGRPFSINIWFKTGRNNQWLIGSNSFFYDSPKSALGFDNHSKIWYASGHNNNLLHWTTAGSTIDYADNGWHMLTLTYDEAVAMIYIDGVLFETKESVDLRWGTDVEATYFGVATTKNGKFGYYNGKLDNFRSYNRALSASEIQTLYQAKQ